MCAWVVCLFRLLCDCEIFEISSCVNFPSEIKTLLLLFWLAAHLLTPNLRAEAAKREGSGVKQRVTCWANRRSDSWSPQSQPRAEERKANEPSEGHLPQLLGKTCEVPISLAFCRVFSNGSKLCSLELFGNIYSSFKEGCDLMFLLKLLLIQLQKTISYSLQLKLVKSLEKRLFLLIPPILRFQIRKEQKWFFLQQIVNWTNKFGFRRFFSFVLEIWSQVNAARFGLSGRL